jgi:hypothetical protein
MRHLSAVIGFGAVLTLTAGCSSVRWNLQRPEGPSPSLGKPADNKHADSRVQSIESIVAYLNNNSSRVRTLQAGSLDVTATQNGQPINLRGKLVAEGPKGFRMSLDGPLGFSQVADLGSNNEEFWFWIKGPIGGPPNPQYFCSYKDLEQGVVSLQVPIQPSWIMETLGIGVYGPADRYTLDYDNQTLRLSEKIRDPRGRVVTKVMIMKRRETKPPDPQITHYILIDDATNREICSAHIAQTMIEQTTGAILPKRIDLNWPQQNATLSIIMDRVAANVSLQPGAFVRPSLSGVQSSNLARSSDTPGVQRVQGVVPR